MKTIGELLARDLSEPIEEVIKLDQQDEQTVYNEIREYIATDRIRKDYVTVLQAIADAPADPTEGVGVWVSGFFGSGKSSFAKNLGYILANRTVVGTPASSLFLRQLEQQALNDARAQESVRKIRERLEYINKRFPGFVLMFDVQKDRAVRRSNEPMAEIMYTVLLRELDYAEDYDLAELEIELEAEGRLGKFVEICADRYAGEVRVRDEQVEVPVTLQDVSPDDYAVWKTVRRGAQRVQRTSAIMAQFNPATYPEADSWSRTLAHSEISIRKLVDRTFELAGRRRPGHAVFFIIDEVGQYIARSAEKIEDLRAVVEHFGLEGKNRVLAGKAKSPAWVIVTSQEKLDEVVAAIDDKRVELARLQDRFRIQIDMAPSDIREVATKRVLAKKPAAEPLLREFYEKHLPLLKTHTRIERTTRPLDVNQDEFVQFYPYLPYLVNLSIDIVSGTRLQRSDAPRHYGGSNRTIIKQAYEMLVGDRTKMADEPIGGLVTLDRIYDLVEGNLSSSKQRDIADIEQLAEANRWTVRTAKAIALLEYVRDLPSTPANIAALLYRRLGDDSPLPQVEQAIDLLRQSQFIRQTENGWKLQTAQEKNWATERNAISPTPRERNDLLAESLTALLSQGALTAYRFRNLRTFRVGVSWDGRALTSGAVMIPLQLKIADDAEEYAEVCDRTRNDSRAKSSESDLYWVMALNQEIDDLVEELHRSRRMVAKYEQLRAQGKLIAEEAASLAQEKSETVRLEGRLADRLDKALAAGSGFFRGVQKRGPELGRTLSEIWKGLFDYAVPDLYPNLEMGARTLKGEEAQEILKAVNLNGLSKIFYDPPDGLGLVVKEGARYVVNLGAPILKEVSSFLEREHAYGNKVTGRTLESHFGGMGYGWEQEILWLVLATLLRAGAVEVTYQGRRFRNHLDPQVRVPFSGANAFRAASFAPRKSVNLQTLVTAVQRYESLTGEEVDVEESAIAQAFQTLARNELQALHSLRAIVQANQIPVGESLEEYQNTLTTILNSASDECVNMLAGEGASFQQARDQVTLIRKGCDEKGLAYLRRLRAAVNQVYPALEAEGYGATLEESAQRLRADIESAAFLQLSSDRDAALEQIETTYRDLYRERHSERAEAFAAALEELRGQPDWPQLAPDLQRQLLQPLSSRACDTLAWDAGGLRCTNCQATLAEMASDLAAVEHLRSNALLQLQKLLAPEERVERVRVAKVVGNGAALSSADDVEKVVTNLKEYLLKLVDAGVKVVLE